VQIARGLLVILVVTSHWFPGLIERLPAFGEVRPFLTPLFNMATPGFAIIFGVGFGYFNYETFHRRRAIFDRQRKLGIAFLAAAILLTSIFLGIERFGETGAVGWRFLVSSLYSVTGYYLLALLTLPFWLAYLHRFRFSAASVLGLLLGFVVVDQISQAMWPNALPDGPAQLAGHRARESGRHRFRPRARNRAGAHAGQGLGTSSRGRSN
jgi:hypothetical protein